MTKSHDRLVKMETTVNIKPLQNMPRLKEEGLTSNYHRTHEFAIGTFFILAAITSFIGLALYQPILNNPEYVITGKANNQIILGAVFELFLACSAVGTAVSMYPYLRRYNESIGLSYVLFRFFEAVFIVIGALSLIAIVSVNQEIANSQSLNADSAITVSQFFLEIHTWTFILGPNFMLGINTMCYSYIYYKTKLIPRKISILGIYASFSVSVAAYLEIFGVIEQVSLLGGILSLPLGLTEMSLAFYVLIKGFNLPDNYNSD